MQENKFTFFQQLPKELQAHTFSFLDDKDQSSASLSCKDWHEVILNRDWYRIILNNSKRVRTFVGNKNKIEEALNNAQDSFNTSRTALKAIMGIIIFSIALYLYLKSFLNSNIHRSPLIISYATLLWSGLFYAEHRKNSSFCKISRGVLETVSQVEREINGGLRR